MIDISPYHLEIVTQILLEHVPDCEVQAFGSRATWTSKDYSDLDLAIVGSEPLEWRTLGELRDAFEESYLPFRVDVLDWHDISDKFREMIREDCIVIFKNGSTHDWKKLTLKQCIEMEVSNYSEKEAWPFINYLDTGNITMNTIKEIQRLVVGRDKVPTRARRKIKPGDIVYSMVRPNQRHFGLIKHPPKNFLVSTGFAVLRGKPGIAHTDFIYYLLAQEHIVDYLQAIAENSTSAYPSIRPHDLEQLEIQLPSLPKQRDIAHILGTLNEKIELNRRMNETLEAMAQALFKSWFIDFDPVRAKIEGRWQPGESLPGLPAYLYDLLPNRLVPSELGEIPEGWQIRPLDSIALFRNGLALQKYRPKDRADRLPVVKIAQLRSGKADSGEWSTTTIGSDHIITAGDIVFSWSGTLIATIWCGEKAALNQHLFKVDSTTYPQWLILGWIRHHLPTFRKIAEGKTTTMGHIKRHHLAEAMCVLPDGLFLSKTNQFLTYLSNKVTTTNVNSRFLSELLDTLSANLLLSPFKRR